ncbi:AI-2E family transporter [Geofilum rubicundum]|uniref:Permease n=1 Tax=Geofilum rubicundum JCM 15548 TaxID=1236989 RepID=A0A0E9LTL2_9BACT|nr:AI-2E family transporter [Geofilum rubicundum]GAO28599.1 permease [Geofilum rubicundum JCM 15548]
MHLSFKNLFFTIASVFGIFAILILAKPVLIPLAFAFLVAFILFPVCQKFEAWGANKIFAAFLSMLSLFLIIAGGLFLFSTQIIDLSENLTEFKEKILEIFTDLTLFINQNFSFVPELERGELLEKIKSGLSNSVGTLVGQTFSGTAAFFTGLITSIVFTFLILIYRDGLVNALVQFFPENHQDKAHKMFKSVQQVGQQYLFGMFIIVLVLGFTNSIGLLIIGIDNPFLFGFLAAILAIIPYAGTLIGAAIPVLYAFMSYDSLWMPISIALFFWVVQFFESNLLTPKIVGGNLKVNAFTSILSIIVGASVWGVAGMILFLPFSAMLKVVCQEYIELKPLALLIGEKNYTDSEKDDKPGLLKKWGEKIKGWF